MIDTRERNTKRYMLTKTGGGGGNGERRPGLMQQTFLAFSGDQEPFQPLVNESGGKNRVVCGGGGRGAKRATPRAQRKGKKRFGWDQNPCGKSFASRYDAIREIQFGGGGASFSGYCLPGEEKENVECPQGNADLKRFFVLEAETGGKESFFQKFAQRGTPFHKPQRD